MPANITVYQLSWGDDWYPDDVIAGGCRPTPAVAYTSGRMEENGDVFTSKKEALAARARLVRDGRVPKNMRSNIRIYSYKIEPWEIVDAGTPSGSL